MMCVFHNIDCQIVNNSRCIPLYICEECIDIDNMIYSKKCVSNEVKCDSDSTNIEDCIDQIIYTTLNSDIVVGVRAFEIDNEYIVAIITTPIYLKSERDIFAKRLESELGDIANKKVYVTYDTDIFLKINDDMAIETKQELKNILISRKSR